MISDAARRPAARRWPRLRPDRELLLLLPALLATLALFIGPFLYGLALSFQPYGNDPAWYASYAKIASASRGQLALWNSLRLAVPATLLDLGLALPVAYRMRRPLAGQRLITALLLIPMTLGSVLIAEGMLQFFGPTGWPNKLLLALHLAREPVQFIHNYLGVLISLVIADFPVVFLVLLGYASGIDPDIERAARVLGAGYWQRLRRITLPLMAPGLATAAALSFVATFSVFPTATMVGQPAGETYVIALAAWQAAYERYDYSEATAIALVMAAVMLAVVGLLILARERVHRVSGEGR